jgi:hypothetical protein
MADEKTKPDDEPLKMAEEVEPEDDDEEEDEDEEEEEVPQVVHHHYPEVNPEAEKYRYAYLAKSSWHEVLLKCFVAFVVCAALGVGCVATEWRKAKQAEHGIKAWDER